MTRISDSPQLGRESPLQANCIRPRGSVGYALPGHRIVRLLAAITLAGASLAPWARGASDSTPVAPKRSSSSFDFSYIVRVSPPPRAHNVRVWIPLPSTDEFQTISELKIQAPATVRMHNEKNGNAYAELSVHSSRTQSPFEIRVTFHVVRYERRLDLASMIDPPGPFPKDVEAFLEPDTQALGYGALAAVVRERTQGLATPLEKARSLYDLAVTAKGYGPEGSGYCVDDKIPASHSSCGDPDSLFIAMAQAAGIPARLEVGFLLPEGAKQGVVTGNHSWAEVYVNGIGWIPVDSVQAYGDPDRRDLFFGAIDANRVMISMGKGIENTNAPETLRAGLVAQPYIEIDGKIGASYSVDFFFDEAKLTTTARSFVRRPICAGGPWLASGRSLHQPA